MALLCGLRGKFISNLGPKNGFFCLISQEFCDFSGTLDLSYLIFLTM